MSTHSDSDDLADSGDLDRTDELPQLDVVAYEAAQEKDALASTDTWLVESMPEETFGETQVRGRSNWPAPGNIDLSLNIDRLRQRIAALEAELSVARNAQREQEAASRMPNAERTELTSRISSLEADNAHLREQQSISQALTQKLQRQLEDEAEKHESRLAQLDATREADREAAERQRIALEQQLERSTAKFTSTADEHAKLRAALEETRELAAARARQIDELQRTVITEHGKAHALGRNLAAKLADYDILSSMVSQRNSTIAALEGMRDELATQLERAFADSHNLTALLEKANERAAASELLAADVASRDDRLAELGAQLESLQREHQDVIAAREELTRALSDAEARSVADQERQQSLVKEIETLRATASALAAERDQLTLAARELDRRTTELAQINEELATVRRDAVSVWAELEAKSGAASAQEQQLTAQQQQIAELQQALDEQQNTREELQRALQDAQRRIERLHAVSADDTRLLNDRTTELAGLRSELESAAATVRGLEHSLHARNTLIEDLRAETRTAQEERAIMSEQLGKARLRVKNMSQQIFNRDNRIATLKADLAVHIEALASIRRDVDGIDADPDIEPAESIERFLEPVNHDAESIRLDRKVMTIGRTNDNDIFIPSKMISRHHARLLIGPNGVIVEDAGSTNGCFVNDQQIKQHVLHEGDVLTIGDLKFRLSIRPAADARGNVVHFNEGRRRDD